MNNPYQILWIDDEWEKMLSFKTYCQLQYNMELTPFKTQKEGLDEYAKNPSLWEAIILDAKVLDESEHEVADVSSLQKAVLRIKENFKVPYFISTGQPDLLSDSTFKSFFPQYYEKAVDDERLCNDIIEAIKDTPARLIRDKYGDVFSWYPNKNELLQILSIFESGDTTDATIFNLIRKELDWFMDYAYDCGLLLEPYTGSDLAEKSKQISLSKIAPIHVVRSLHSVCEICNNGSHSLSVSNNVKKGQAPYLVRSTIMEFMNIAYWANLLPKTNEERNALRDYVRNNQG